MLEYLRIENLILIDRAEIQFGDGLNILTGETGSGKSAILTAIRLLCGDKADPQWIRSGSLCAAIEGRVRFSSLDDLAKLCRSSDLEIPPSTLCTIRRELLASGKNRILFNDQQINLSVLRKLTAGTIEVVDQNSAQDLTSHEAQRKLLDLWGNINLDAFQMDFAQELHLNGEMIHLTGQKEHADAERSRAESDLEEIDAAAWQNGEDEALSVEHHRLCHAEQLTEQLNAAQRDLSEGAPPLPALLSRLSHSLQSLTPFDPSLSEAAQLLKNASLEVIDAERIIQRALTKCEMDPERLQHVEKRIGAIERIKRRFGKSFQEVQKIRQSLLSQIQEIEQIDDKLKEAQEDHAKIATRIRHMAGQISASRRQAAVSFQEQIARELQFLNLPHARFEVRIEEKVIGPDGADSIRFLFTANPGQPLLPLEDCASGGEMSRLLFVIKVLLAKQEGCSCLIFDEIDNNVGGQTASILGQKLQILAANRQVICITHFVQVAQCAMHHFLVSKIHEQKQTRTVVQKLNLITSESEYQRMIGKCY